MEQPTTAQYGLKHEEWRPGQLEMILAVEGSASRWVVVSAPTGSGKTALPTALAAAGGNVVALVETKELQSSNYQPVGFSVVFGRDNYMCALPELEGKTAAHCKFPANMRLCPYCRSCQYFLDRETAMASSAASLNYAYYLHAAKNWPIPKWLVCDEAHNLSEITIEWAGLFMSAKQAGKYALPAIPFIIPVSGGSAFDKSDLSVTRAFDWLKASHTCLTRELERREASRLVVDKDAKELFSLKMLISKFEATIQAMNTSLLDWYVAGGPTVGHDMNGGPEFGILIKPLTARHFFQNLFGSAGRTVMMSATLGQSNMFVQELGLDKVGFMFHQVPPVWPAATRPVYALDVPRLGNKATESAWQKQADEIGHVLNHANPFWTGIVHTNSKVRAADLANRLARITRRPLFVPDARDGTEIQIAKWVRFRDTRTGAICIAWNLHEGYNGTQEKICVCAKVPFPNLASEYERARMEHFGHNFLARTANEMEQILGRTRRGEAQDYDTDGEHRGYVAIADGAYAGPASYLSPYFKESIVKGRGWL